MAGTAATVPANNVERPHITLSIARRAAAAVTITLFAAAASGCSPEEVEAFLGLPEHQQHEVIAALQRPEPAEDKFAGAISPDGLARLRACESGGNYGAIGGGGSFRGAYQFTRQTWNGTAGRFYPELHGVDPANAAPHDQDRMARALWANGGPRNWPVCSRRV